MVHCGYEATAVTDATRNLPNMLHALKPIGKTRVKEEELEVSGAGR